MFFYEHFFHIDNPFVKEKQQAINTRSKDDDDYGVSTKRKRKHLQPMVNHSNYHVELVMLFHQIVHGNAFTIKHIVSENV
jgi:hypothetical protein